MLTHSPAQLAASPAIGGGNTCNEVASCLDALQFAAHKISLHVGWNPAGSILLHYKQAVMVELIDRAFHTDMLQWV